MRAARDMTQAQFEAALKRRGWRSILLWIDVGNGRSIGKIMINGKFNRRASLAYAARKVAKPCDHIPKKSALDNSIGCIRCGSSLSSM
jgi:hypothetical protein